MTETYPLILRLDANGTPMKWILWQEAICLHARERIVWTAGENKFILHGGHSRLSGAQTTVELNSIIAVRGENKHAFKNRIPPLNNRELFRRDQHICLYCGKHTTDKKLTRDHIVPVAQGGKDSWSNVITACKKCNTRKGCRTPDQAHMPLLAVPFIPNMAEYLVLRNRRILSDQMDFLKTQFNLLTEFRI